MLQSCRSLPRPASVAMCTTLLKASPLLKGRIFIPNPIQLHPPQGRWKKAIFQHGRPHTIAKYLCMAIQEDNSDNCLHNQDVFFVVLFICLLVGGSAMSSSPAHQLRITQAILQTNRMLFVVVCQLVCWVWGGGELSKKKNSVSNVVVQAAKSTKCEDLAQD